jgi:thiazole synthase ThiGH ThiG subunit
MKGSPAAGLIFGGFATVIILTAICCARNVALRAVEVVSRAVDAGYKCEPKTAQKQQAAAVAEQPVTDLSGRRPA